ncbi:hypothetical protein PENTCL1PPCAC_18324, partial [Pristionchus entomophagus]
KILLGGPYIGVIVTVSIHFSQSLPGVFRGSEPHEYLLVIRDKEVRGLYGNVLVRAVVGSVRIDGGLVKESEKNDLTWHNVCAPVRNGRPIYIAIDQTFPTTLKDHRIRWRIKDLSPDIDDILKYILSAGDVMYSILLVSKKPTVEARVAHSLHETFLAPVHSGHIRYSSHFTASFFNLLLPDTRAPQSYSDESIARIDEAINDLLGYDGPDRLSVVITGCKGVGKSTFSRKLVNYIWGNGREIYYMDLDIGQSEFTPPGIISCTRVTKPILDLPFNHQEVFFENAFFVGNITVKEDDEKRYISAVDALYDKYLEISPPKSTLIINTMGWIEQFGRHVLDHVCQKIYPRYVLRISGAYDQPSPMYQLPLSLASNLRQVTVGWRPGHLRGESPLSAANLRELTTISYFAKCLPESRPVLSAIVEAVPFQIDFSSLCIILPPGHRSLPDKAVFSALNLSIVALCSIGDCKLNKATRRRMLGSDKLPWLVLSTPNTPPTRVMGYGIIRGADMETRRLYVISPLSMELMNEVDSMASLQGVPLPLPIIQTQPHTRRPYVLGNGEDTGGKSGRGVIKDLYVPFVSRTAMNNMRKQQERNQ